MSCEMFGGRGGGLEGEGWVCKQPWVSRLRAKPPTLSLSPINKQKNSNGRRDPFPDVGCFFPFPFRPHAFFFFFRGGGNLGIHVISNGF